MTQGFLAAIGLFILLGACTQRLVCPAYESSFIYDKETLRQKFSYFKEDSTPKILTASKSKYLIAVPESYRKKYKKMQTVEMKPVYPVIPDSLKIDKGADLILAEADVVDSVTAAKKIEPGDSAYAITKTKEKFNLDQDLYMWYFREILVLPDVRAAMQKKDEEKKGGPAKTAKKEKVGFIGFFKNIFKKKPKNDSTATKPLVAPQDNATGTTTAEPPKKKKGGLFRKKTDPLKKEDGED